MHEVKQAAPMTPQLLLRLSRVVKFTDDTELVAWTATLLGFHMFLRKSNLVPDTMDTYDMSQQFRRADINITSINSAMMVEIRWSKTILFKQRILRLPVMPAENKRICPVFWTTVMLNKIPARAQDPALTIKAGDTTLALSANQLIYRLRKWLLLIGEDATKYSLHSLRRGGGHSPTNAISKGK